MVWPIPVLPTDRTNDTDQLDLHPGDHNALADAINELAARAVFVPGVQLVGYARGTAAQTTISTATDLTGVAVSFTAIATHRYLTLLGAPRLVQQVAAGEQRLLIRDQANVELAVTTQQTHPIPSTCSHFVMCIETGISGAVTRKGSISCNPGNVETTGGAGNKYLPVIVVIDLQ